MTIWIACDFSEKLKLEYKASKSFERFSEEFGAYKQKTEKTVSQWADENRILQAETSKIPGKWRTSANPPLREVMDTFNDPDIRQVDFCCGTQIGKTEVLNNISGFIVDEAPASTIMTYPREDDAKMISRTRVQPLFRACASIAEKIPAKEDLFQTLEMHFPGMVFYMIGMNSAAAAASKPAPNILRDEIDKYPDSVRGDADPLSLTDERTKSFHDIRKIYNVSSPTVKHRGIWAELQKCDEIRKYHMPCIHCGAELVFDFDRVRFEKDGEDRQTKKARARLTARYVCQHCEKEIDHSDKIAMLSRGRWVAEKPFPFVVQRVGYWLSSLYSPFLTWGDIAEKFVEAECNEAEGKSMTMQNFRNGWLALPAKEKIEAQEKIDITSRVKADIPALIVPNKAVALTCGIDMQKSNFYASVWAFSETLESWKILHTVLPGWSSITDLVYKTTFEREGTKKRLHIWRCAIDTGGGEGNEEWSRTAEAYAWIRKNGGSAIFATKGLSRPRPDSPIVRYSVLDKMPGKGGGAIEGGLVLWLINTDRLKDLFFTRLKYTDGDPQPIHFCAGTDQAFLDQITAEEKRKNNQGVYYWHKVRKANHYLDTALLAHAVADPEWAGGVPLLAAQIAQSDDPEETAKRNREENADDVSGGWLPSRDSWMRRR